jgi:hypothetical protein
MGEEARIVEVAGTGQHCPGQITKGLLGANRSNGEVWERGLWRGIQEQPGTEIKAGPVR